ncbi:uncharacterized protein PAC_18312 [Phialocephala subalpina]|uniref:Uncharacterized protein n=1 Tax=Phialocephala subalpina TaxID=576137 RepID=A0A1L7XTP5_9HELO|nr:uncharacterized protein PAC_18312 [Phialocephala subalpina]
MSLAEGVHQLLEDCSALDLEEDFIVVVGYFDVQMFADRLTFRQAKLPPNPTASSSASTRAKHPRTHLPLNVKNTWTKRGIWNRRWGILPGMSWKHEEPLEEEAADGPAPVPANPLVNGSQEAGEAPAIRIFGSPPPRSIKLSPGV